MVSYLVAIVAERRKWFLCLCTAARDQRFTGMSRAGSTHPLAPSLPQKDAGKRGKNSQKAEARSQKGPNPAPEHSHPGPFLPHKKTPERVGKQAGRGREKNSQKSEGKSQKGPRPARGLG